MAATEATTMAGMGDGAGVKSARQVLERLAESTPKYIIQQTLLFPFRHHIAFSNRQEVTFIPIIGIK